MGARREGREAAMQYLYLADLAGRHELTPLEDFFKIRSLSPSARKFCRTLVNGILKNLEAIDSTITSITANYELSRISVVDRNILRLAIYEMLQCPETPPVVSINEAIEIAKKYSTEESGRFVNGILDKVRSDLKRPARAGEAEKKMKHRSTET